MYRSKWNEQQQARAEILFRMFPRLEQAYNLYLELLQQVHHTGGCEV